MLRLKFYLMCDNCNSGVIQVEPGGNLPVSDDEDVSHPGGVSLHRAQRVAELLVILEPAGWNIFILFGLQRKISQGILLLTMNSSQGYKEDVLYLWDSGEVPEQVAWADG